MAKRQIKETICSFCIESFPDKSMYKVRIPMFRMKGGEDSGTYCVPCCAKCITKKETLDWITEIAESPKKA